MADSLSKTLGLDLPALAEMLRSKGRGRDTVLAHITPKEAALLKRRGGRGSINPQTGLPEYEDVDFESYDYSAPAPVSPVYDVIEPSGEFYQYTPGGDYTAYTPGGEDYAPYVPPYTYDAGAAGQAGPTYEQLGYTPPAPQDFAAQLPAGYDVSKAGFTPEEMAAGSSRAGTFIPSPAAPDVTTGTGISPYTADEVRALQKIVFGDQQTQEELQKEKVQKETDYAKWLETLARLGLSAATIAGLSRYVQQPTQATAARQVANAANAISTIGAPYRQIGGQLMGQGLTGGLSPGQVQAVNAARAQGAQDISRRGGVGVLQYANSVADLTARLMENQFKLGLATSAIGDQYALQAIQTQLAGDQQINKANTDFYTQLANMFAPYIFGGAAKPFTTQPASPLTINVQDELWHQIMHLEPKHQILPVVPQTSLLGKKEEPHLFKT